MHIHENSIMTLLQPLIVCHSPFKFFHAIQFKWLSHPILGFCYFRRKCLVSNKLEAFYCFCYQSSYHLHSWHKSCRLRQLTLSGCVIHLLGNVSFELFFNNPLSLSLLPFHPLLLSFAILLSHSHTLQFPHSYLFNLFKLWKFISDPVEINRKLSLPAN